jgi:hypothetical protein
VVYIGTSTHLPGTISSTNDFKTGEKKIFPKLFLYPCCQNQTIARLWWLTPVIPAAQEAEIRKITVRS